MKQAPLIGYKERDVTESDGARIAGYKGDGLPPKREDAELCLHPQGPEASARKKKWVPYLLR
ncbi:MAG: hypothetical protein ACUVWO_13065 [Thermodesulfobacteriota bacterium]